MKEAVADAVGNIIYGNVSGAGEFGTVVYGAAPSRLFVSGFLLPQRETDDGDEVTSPIWISSHGLDLQLAAAGTGSVTVRAQFAIYVRVFPTEADLRRPDCRLRLPPLEETKRRELKDKYRAKIDARWAELQPKYKAKQKCPLWKDIMREELLALYKREKLPIHDWLANDTLPAAPAGGQEMVEEGNDTAAEGDAVEAMPPPAVHFDAACDVLFEPVEPPQKWHRLLLELPPLIIDPYADQAVLAAALVAHNVVMETAVANQIAAWLDDTNPLTGGNVWVYRRNEAVKASERENWAKYLTDMRARNHAPYIPEIKPCWDIEPSRDFADPSRMNLHVALENHSKPLERSGDRIELSLFQVAVEVDLPLALHRSLRLDRVEPSYRYNRYMSYPAIGYNGGVAQALTKEGRIRLCATWAPRYVQPRVRPLDYPGVVRKMRDLSTAADVVGLTPIVTHFKQWIAELPGKIDPTVGATNATDARREKHAFAGHLKQWEHEADSIAAGIAMLDESRQHWVKAGPQDDPLAIPFEAWRAMNETMANLMHRLSGKDEGKWHLFQLAFVLATLPSVVTRMPQYQHRYDPKRDDAVTLIYFSTGGGKSEAFFGLLVFTLFLDRMRGKTFGVTALVRYPLRLLTVNQAQRMARLLAQAEIVRVAKCYSGTPFAIGFWVGGSGTPNSHKGKGVKDIPFVDAVTVSETKLNDDDPHYAAARKAWRKLPTCPFCGGETGLRRLRDLQGGTIAHICHDPKCFSQRAGPGTPLPFYICDEDIYELAPAVILGTVDKLALIGHSAGTIRRVLGMFGAAPWRNASTGRLQIPLAKSMVDGPAAHGCEALYPAYENGVKLFHDPPPALIVQDEAHLLDESLGSFAGLFESALDAIFSELAKVQRHLVAEDAHGNRRRAKIIAASATVADPERQLEHLYQRHIPATQFPHPGPDIYHSFYAAPQPPDEDMRKKLPDDLIELKAKTGRYYRAIMTNGRPHTATAVSILASFHATITGFLQQLLSDDAAAHDAARNLMLRHLSPGVTEPFLRAALAVSTATHLATLIDLHRVALTYVTNKKGGDQIQAAEAEETRKRHAALQLPFDSLRAKLITGSVDQGEIEKTVELTRNRPKDGMPFPPLAESLRSIVATSAISHGVDIEELNSMFFAGLPSDVAEYIQASSRIGRTHVGFSLLMPTPQRRRDRYVVEVFDIFHRFLERMVQPAAIDRWAEIAVLRVLPSFFQSAVCGAVSLGNLLALPDAEKGKWKPLDHISQILDLHSQDKKAFEDRITDFIELAIGLTQNFAPDGKDHYQRMVRDTVRSFLDDMAVGSYKNTNLFEYFRDQNVLRRPMTSLRDVDEGGSIRKGSSDPNPKGKAFLDPEDVIAVMDTIRYGTAEAGERE
ncbi:MAG: helicase-related protein [Pseudomonadota bacterium]